MKRESVLILSSLLLSQQAQAEKVSPFLMEAAEGIQAVVSQEIEASALLTRPLDAELIETLERAGAIVERLPSGQPASAGRTVSLLLDPGRMKDIAALPEIVRLVPAKPPYAFPPLAITGAMVGAPRVWNAPAGLAGFTGEGVVLADQESNWDIFHPDLFRADGGGYDFEDVDGDGRVDAGDRVDLDGDGIFESELRLLSLYDYDEYSLKLRQPSRTFRPGLDWLYVDLNGNGKRDHGADAGFTDADPAFGEPIFIADDLNADGIITPDERLLRLGTSKIRSIHPDRGTALRRGENLSTYKPKVSAFMSVLHGTNAIGTAVAGWPGVNRDIVGIAPHAELVLLGFHSGPRAAAIAREEKIDVLFIEFGAPIDFHDGSGPHEEAWSQATREGTTVITAAGNLAGLSRTARMKLLAGKQETIRLRTHGPDSVPTGITAAFTWRGDPAEIGMDLVYGDERLSLDSADGTSVSFAGMAVRGFRDRSPRGTAGIFLRIDKQGPTLPSIDITVELTAQARGIDELRAIVADEFEWLPGSSFLDHVDDEITALTPSTADHVISVGAFAGSRPREGQELGGVANYSGRGLRIDGARVIDILAPDDPMTPAWLPDFGHLYMTFSGTSAAIPHVAGAAALLKEAFPAFQHDDIKAALTASARADAHTGPVPNSTAGFGKLDVAHAVLGEVPTLSGPIGLRLELEGRAILGEEATVRAVLEKPDGGADEVSVEFDVGWDGHYEISRSSTREALFHMTHDRIPVVARAFDSTGQVARAVIWVDAEPHCEDIGCETGCCLEDGSCGSCEQPPRRRQNKDSGGCSTAGGDALSWLLLPGFFAWYRANRRNSLRTTR